MRSFITVFTMLCAFSVQGWANWDDYAERYPLKDVYEKLVDNRGNGFEPLYGTRNFRQVLKGVVYRGGANNKFHKSAPRSNSNPLPPDGLANLCNEGFQKSYYLYSENYDPATEHNTCLGPEGKDHSLRYLQRSGISDKGRNEMLEEIHKALQNPNSKPIYLHCWNGWHASGYISAVTLMQFCGWSAEDAVSYWDANTDGVNTEPQYEKIRQRIRNYVPRKDLQISSKIQSKVCQ